MKTIALLGAGKIGDAICGLLSTTGRYTVRLADKDLSSATRIASHWGERIIPSTLNLDNKKETEKLLKGCDAVISALPFFCNVTVATYAKSVGIHYLDLTEDVQTTQKIKALAEGSSVGFMPQCGLAPGFISVAAAHLSNLFDTVDTIKMRVGALPIYPSNRLKYNMTWSTEGLVNEYGNPCELLVNGNKELSNALEGYERFSLDGVEYEAFNTSGGLGTICDTLEGKVKNINYKSVRYPGHREFIAFLMHDLGFNNRRKELCALLDKTIPTTKQDKVIVYVEVIGTSNGKLAQKTYASTIYNQLFHNHHLGAIQVTTASGICAPLDLLLNGQLTHKAGFLKMEDIGLPLFLSNEFGWFYKDERALSVSA